MIKLPVVTLAAIKDASVMLNIVDFNADISGIDWLVT